MKKHVKAVLQLLPLFEYVNRKRKLLWINPGHYYSPIVKVQDILQHEKQIFAIPTELPGIDLRTEQQLSLLEALKMYYKEMPFKAKKVAGLRYYFDNPLYSYADAIIYYSMIRHFKPRRIIEVGSGFSSALALDVNERFFNNKIQISFIEPYPAVLFSTLKPAELKTIKLYEQRIQDVELSIFDTLTKNDILFIDSTHVVKTGSDVNHLVFQVLPRLKRGVLIHIHDQFYPFEYPKEWVLEGRSWTEDYLLHAFLQFNTSFQIVLFNTYIEHFYEAKIRKYMPLCLKNKGGGIWLRRVA